jgi:cytoskeletal protein CcmA (bactofilin family)
MLNRDPFFGRPSVKPAPAPTPKPAEAGSGSSQLAPAPEIPATEDNRSAAKPAAVQGSQLIVGPNIKLKGVEITDCDTLVVEGHVEATMDSRAIQIAPNGTFSGTAGIDVAEIHGGFTGELTVRKCLTIHANGKVCGKIRYGKVVIEEGGEISGDIKKLDSDEKVSRVTSTATGRSVGGSPVLQP